MKKQRILFLILFITGYGLVFSQRFNEIKVFPNPATNVVNVLGLYNSTKARISITDIYGNKELSFSWEIKNNALNIPITNLEQGIYHITIHSKEQFVQEKFYKK